MQPYKRALQGLRGLRMCDKPLVCAHAQAVFAVYAKSVRTRAVRATRKHTQNAVSLRRRAARRIVKRCCIQFDADAGRDKKRGNLFRVQLKVLQFRLASQKQYDRISCEIQFTAFVVFQTVQRMVAPEAAADLDGKTAEGSCLKRFCLRKRLQLRQRGAIVKALLRQRDLRARSTEKCGKVIAL